MIDLVVGIFQLLMGISAVVAPKPSPPPVQIERPAPVIQAPAIQILGVERAVSQDPCPLCQYD